MKTDCLSHEITCIYNKTSQYTHKYDTESPSAYRCTHVTSINV